MDNCKVLSQEFRDSVKKLVVNWRNAVGGSKKASFSVLKHLRENYDDFGSFSEEEQNFVIASYFEQVILSYTNDGDEVEIPSVHGMDRILSDYQQKIDNKTAEEQGALERIPIVVGSPDYAKDFDITDIPNRDIAMSSKKRRNALADIVERNLRRSLGSSYDENVHGKIVGSIRGNSYEGSVQNLYRAVVLASLTDELGDSMIPAAELQRVLQGDKAATMNMNSRFEVLGLDEGKEYTGLESRIMSEIVDLYLAQNKELQDQVKAGKARTIRAASTATRVERVFANALRSVRKSYDADELDFGELSSTARLGDGKLTFTITRNVCEKIEEVLKSWADRIPKSEREELNTFGQAEETKRTYNGNPFDGMAEVLMEALGDDTTAFNPQTLVSVVMEYTTHNRKIVRDINGNIVNVGVKKDSFAKKPKTDEESSYIDYQRKKDGTLANGQLSSNEVTELLTECYAVVTSRYNWSDSSAAFQEELMRTAGQKFVFNGFDNQESKRDTWFHFELMPILEDLRESLLVQEAQDKEEREEYDEYNKDESLRSKQSLEVRRMTTTACAAVYDSKTLQARTDAVLGGIFAFVDGHRWSEVANAEQAIKDNKELIKGYNERVKKFSQLLKHPESWKDELGIEFEQNSKLRNLSEKEAIQAIIEEAQERADMRTAENEDLKNYIKDLYDDNLFFAALLKRNMAEALKNGEKWVLKDGSDYQTAEATTARRVLDELKVRALAELEDRTGIHIILNRKTLQYDVVDPSKSDDINKDNIAEDEDDEGINMKNDDMDFRDDVDPFAHLSVNVRFALSRIPKTDFAGNFIYDDLGNRQFWDPKDIYAGLMDLCNDLVIEPEDLYTLVKRGLDNKNKEYPALNPKGGKTKRSKGRSSAVNRTAKEAFTKGMPDFKILRENADRYPWINQLIDILEEDWCEFHIPNSAGAKPRQGKLTTNLFCQLGHSFMKRMQVKDNKMVVSNEISEVQNAKATQRHMFYTKSMLSDKNGNTLPMLWSTSATWSGGHYGNQESGEFSGAVVVRNMLDAVLNEVNITGYKSGLIRNTEEGGTTRAAKDAAQIGNALRAMGLDIPYETIENILTHGNSASLGRLRNLIRYCKYAATHYAANQDTQDIYEDNYNNWKKIYELAGPLVRTQAHLVTSTENGKTRQNYILPNAFTTRFDLLGYGSATMRRVRNESYGEKGIDEKILKKRKEKIDAMYRDVPGMFNEETGKYNNHLLQQFYEGNIDVGQYMQSDTYEGKDYRQLSMEEQLCLQLAAFERPAVKEGKIGQPEYIQFASMADVPIAQFYSVDYGKGIDQAIDAITARVLRERETILAHKGNHRPYILSYAVANNKVRRDYTAYYNAIEGKWLPIPAENVATFKETVKLVERYKALHEASTQEEKDKAQKSLDDYKKKHPRAVELYGIDSVDEYVEFSRWQPREGYFSREEKYGELPDLNTIRMSRDEVISRLQERMEEQIAAKGKKITDAEREEIENNYYEAAEALSYLDGREMTMDEMLDEAAPTLAEDIARVFTERGMDARFKRYMKKLRVPFREYSEKANLNRIEHTLRGEPDFDGEYWDINQDEEGNLMLISRDGERRPVMLNEHEAAYANSRMNSWLKSNAKRDFDAQADQNDPMYPADYMAAMQDYFSRKKEGEIPGTNTVHKFSTILDFQPPLKNQKEIMNIIKTRRSTAKKTAKVSFGDMYDAVQRLFYHTFAANTETLELFGMRSAMFKNPDEMTKRLKMLYSNGLRLDTNNGEGQTVERMLILADYKTQISSDLTHKIREFADEVDAGNISEEDALQKILAFCNINATDAQGYLLPDAYDRKASQAGSAYMDSRKAETLDQIREGKPRLEGYDQTYSVGTIKQIGMGVYADTDPRGRTEMIPVGVKNSEAILLSADNIPNAQRSAVLMAVERYCTNKDNKFSDGTQIDSIQRASGVKTTKKGILALHYIQERIDALGQLGKLGAVTSEQAKAFVDEWSEEVDNVMTLDEGLVVAFNRLVKAAMGRYNKDFMTFDDLDKYVHDEIQKLVTQYMNTKNSATRKDILEGIENMRALINFMLPVKSTERTLKQLDNVIDNAVRNEDGSMNEQYVMTIERKWQHMQIRPTNHSLDSKAHLGSQMSYIMQTAIDFSRDAEHGYELPDGTKLSGKEIYHKFNEILAQRLLIGAKEAGKKFSNLRELRDYMINIIQNNPKYGPEMIRALDIVNSAIDGRRGKERFNTPLSSVAVIYKVSDILTSIIRGKTHRRPVNGGAVVIEADSMYDDDLGIARDENGKMIGVECYLPAWSKKILESALKTKRRRRMVDGKEVIETYQYLDFDKIKGTGLEKMIGYRIPSEDLHSILPLIVKGFLPEHRGSAIVVAKEIVTLTGGDNDIDKLFLMIKRINKTALSKDGKLQPVGYDIKQPVEEQSEDALENMLIDLVDTILTDPANAARFASFQNPNSLTDYATVIAHNSLPYEQQMKIKRDTGELVYEPENPDWNDGSVYQPVSKSKTPGQIGLEKMSEHIEFLDTRCVNDLGDMVYFKEMHALAKLGVAIAADNTSIFSKVMAGAEAVQEELTFKFNEWGRLPEGISIDGKALNMYCPRQDLDGGSAYENCSNFAATLVDSGNSPDVKRLGITLQNASLAAFFLRCGLTPEMMSYMINILANTPNFKKRYSGLYNKLTKETDDGTKNGALASTKNLGSFSMDDLKKAQALSAHGGLMNEDVLANNPNLMSVLHVMNYLMSVHDNIMPWTKTLKMNSTKHALSNEPASAVYAQLLVEDVERKANEGEFMIDIPTSMVIHSGLTAEQVAMGKFKEEDGTEKESGVHMVQAYYTCGIELFGKVMYKRLFYAHPAFKELVNAFKETIMNMPKDDAVAFIKLLHDEFSTFYLSGSNLVKDDFVVARNYYRNEFPKLISQTLREGGAMKEKYAILDVLMVKDGRLMINDERMSDKGVAAVRDSLVKMAKSPIKKEKDLAKDIFMNAFFTDGLRFGYGSVSKVFTPSFLADDVFSEYNEAIDALCSDRLVTGDDLKNFMQQFICNNYNSKTFAFGPLIRAVSGAKKNDEGLWESVESEELVTEDDEVTYKDVRDLEMWLTRDWTDGRLMMDIKGDVVTAPGGRKQDVPRGIIDMVERLELKEGDVFRLQTSFSPYDQNLYMIDNAGNDQLCIIKLNDFLSTKVYDRGADFRTNAQRNCSVGTRGKAGVWELNLTGSALRSNEMRKAFLNGGLNSYLKSVNEKTKQRQEEAAKREQYENTVATEDSVQVSEYGEQSVSAEDQAYVSVADAVENAASSSGLFDDEFTKEQEARKAQRAKQLKRAKYKGGRVTNISITGDEAEALSTYNSSEISDDGKSQIDKFFEREDGTKYEPALKAMFDLDSDDENMADRMADVMTEHGADQVFNTKQEAIDMAAQINNSQDEFIATIKPDGDGFVVELGDAMDDTLAEQWAEQYGQSVVTGPRGINSVMNKIGSHEQGDFVSFDEEYNMDDYNEEIEDLIDLIRNSHTSDRFPKITKKTAEDVVKRLRKTAKINGFYTNLKRVMMDAANGDAAATTTVMEMLGYIDTIGPVLERINGVTDINDEVLDREATSIIVEALTDSEATLRRFGSVSPSGSGSPSEYIAKKFKDQLLAGIREEIKKLNNNDVNTLRDIKSRAVANHGTLSPEERHRLDSQNRRNSNQLNEMDRLEAILYDALQMEEQKRKMLIEDGQDTSTSKDRIEILEQILGNESTGPNIHGVVNYLGYLIGEYRFCANAFNSLPDLNKQQNLENLYKVKRVLQSHELILEALKELMDDDRFMDKFNELYAVLGRRDAVSIRDLVNNLVELNKNIRNQYAEHASKEFIGFVREFVGEDETVMMPDGTTMTWEQLFEQYDGDISFFDKWMRSMSDTNDPIGQIYNRVVQKQKDKARMQAIKDQQGEIQELNSFIIANNLDDFEFMFEHTADGKKTGYYLTDVEYGRFYDELEQKQAERDEILNDRHATKEQKKAAEQAYKAWFDSHAVVDRTGHITPNKSMYASAEYERLKREEPKKFEFLKKFMKIKMNYDSRLGAHTNNSRAIQRRMSSEQRFKANFTLSPSAFWDNVKRKLAEDYLVQEDDYMEAGQTSTVLNFDGTRRMVMPAPYTRMLANPDELSTDPIGCLVAYSYATANYTAMREIANPLEVGFDAMLEGRIQYEMQNGRQVVEQFKASERKRAIVKESRFFQKLRSFMDSQLYMRYIEDADDTFKIFGKEFRRSKVVNAFLHMSAVAQLGFNWLVDLANLANGIAQTNIEAAARRFFRGATLLQADKEYTKALQEFIPDLSNPIKQSKLALVGEKLNIMQNFDVKVYNNRRNSLIAKLFNSNVAFLGTACGNHWLYNRVAIAMMLETEVMVPGEHGEMVKTNLWDAFEVVTNEHGGKTLSVKAGATIDGHEVTDEWLSDFGRRIAKVNQSLLGIYNRDDMNMAQKLSMTKLLIAFRKHIAIMMDKRYRKRHRVAEFAGTDQEFQEGYMRTLGRFLIGLHEASYKIPAVWGNLTEQEKQNVWMAVTDIAQWAALFALMSLADFGGGDDDDDEEYLEKMCKFLLAREAHELGSMLPTLYMPKEGINIINQPFMGTGQLEDLYNFTSTALQPWTWDERVKAGPFQGQSQIEMRFRKLPIPILSYYRNVDKSLHGIDNSTWFYNRGYVGGGGKVGKM